MKVVIAGYPKTGTQTTANALKILGYDVYGYMEHFYYHRKEWKKILTHGGSVDDFKRMYEDVDAVTDAPAYFFWRQIIEAFPDVLIILTRSNSRRWSESYENYVDMVNSNIMLKLFWSLSPFGWSFRKHVNAVNAALFGQTTPHTWSKQPFNRMIMLNRYSMHNSDISKSVPGTKLLVYNIDEGWDPLCQFLRKDVPDVCFPHKSVKGTLTDWLLKENDVVKKLKFHTVVAGALWLSVVGSVALYIVKRVRRKQKIRGHVSFAGFL